MLAWDDSISSGRHRDVSPPAGGAHLLDHGVDLLLGAWPSGADLVIDDARLHRAAAGRIDAQRTTAWPPAVLPKGAWRPGDDRASKASLGLERDFRPAATSTSACAASSGAFCATLWASRPQGHGNAGRARRAEEDAPAAVAARWATARGRSSRGWIERRRCNHQRRHRHRRGHGRGYSRPAARGRGSGAAASGAADGCGVTLDPAGPWCLRTHSWELICRGAGSQGTAG